MEYFSIKDYTTWFSIAEDASPNDRMIEFMMYYLDKNEDEIRQMSPNELFKQYDDVSKLLESTIDSTFYPFIEIDNKLYGYIDLSKMTLGEYVDIEKYSKNVNENMGELMSILYRPVISHKFESLKFEVANTFNVYRNKLTNFYDYYELEEYNYANSATNISKIEKLPIAFARGAISFFLLQTSSVGTSTNLYSSHKPKEIMKIMKESIQSQVTENDMESIGDGLRQFATYLQLPSLTSQATKGSQISITSLSSIGSLMRGTLTELKRKKLNNKNKLTNTDTKLNNNVQLQQSNN
jgi:hypothetical protein